jgi:hypothetical protein
MQVMTIPKLQHNHHQLIIVVPFDLLFMCFVTFMNTMEVCFNDDQHLFAKKIILNHEKNKSLIFLSSLFKWLQDEVFHFQ